MQNAAKTKMVNRFKTANREQLYALVNPRRCFRDLESQQATRDFGAGRNSEALVVAGGVDPGPRKPIEKSQPRAEPTRSLAGVNAPSYNPTCALPRVH